ncbi:MAG: hypothetical protein QOD77_1112 [Thermoplasmata archaeon]|jgi:hypothetical protein|nr:hypothetical protein [Thermoplasmata archaeon]
MASPACRNAESPVRCVERMRLLVAILVAAVAFAGCTTDEPAPPQPPGPPAEPAPDLLFGTPVMVDADRIASEPSVKSDGTGALFICAPTGSIKYATRPQDLLVEADKGAFQSAIWRSLDNGTTWQFAETPVAEGTGLPYHSALPGAGDCDLAVDADGAVYMTDQLGLASEVMSVSFDQGQTWEVGSPLASGSAGVDRQWLWPDPTTPGTVYMVFNGQGQGITVSKTTDSGKTWTAVVATDQSSPPGTIVALNGTVAFAHRPVGGKFGFVHSEDAGATWDTTLVDVNLTTFQDFFPQLFADAAGTLYLAWTETSDLGTAVAYSFSKDLGATWSPKTIAFDHPGRSLFLWGTAGSAGRLGFSWYEAPDPDGAYYVHAGVVHGADTASPVRDDVRVDAEPVRPDPPCEDGALCTGGRELGDFQMCAIDPAGNLLVSYVRVLPDDAAGRIMFAKATGANLFAAGETFDPWVV